MACRRSLVSDRFSPAVLSCCILLLHLASWPAHCTPLRGHDSSPLRAFRNCINANYTTSPTTWDQAVLQEALPRLYIQGMWQSKKPLQGPLTIVTHTSFSRLFQLRAQCRSWGGPIVAAVHLALSQPAGLDHITPKNTAMLRAASRQLARLFYRAEMVPRCQLSLVLLWEVYTDPDALVLYPYNTLRNYALAIAHTKLVVMLDVDLLPSNSLLPDLLATNGLPDDFEGGMTALILPAFETVSGSHGLAAEMAIASRAVDGGKASLAALVGAGLVRPFHQERYPAGHNCTNYPNWYTATSPYKVSPTPSYEPWFVLRRETAPWYDERYRGYFYDKIVYVSALKAAGFSFSVHPRAFTVHRPHSLTPALQSPLLKQLQGKMHGKYAQHLKAMRQAAAGSTAPVGSTGAAFHYSPQVDSTFLRCASLLPWMPAEGDTGRVVSTQQQQPARHRHHE